MNTQTWSPSGCHVMAKPTGSKCNIDCSYCFYLEKEKLYPERGQDWMMGDETLSAYILQHIEAQSGNEVVFAWQGGEPTLRGLAFFEQAVRLQHEYARGKKVINTFQTNGILIDEKWCAFFNQHNFLIGISIDGPAELHDIYRRTRSGKATHHKVETAILLLKQYKVEFNTLTVVSRANVDHALSVYRYLKGLGSSHMQFIPLVERKASKATASGLTLINPESKIAGQLCDWSVDAKAYGQFMSQIFHHWVRHDIGQVFVQLFENTFALVCGQPAQICVFAPQCGSAFALEANGDLYSCDHYVYPEYKLGNIHESTIAEMNRSDANRRFGAAKSDSLCEDCRRCECRPLCHGGCPKHRFAISASGKPDLNYLCPGYKAFFHYASPYLAMMKKLYLHNYPPAAIMQIIQKKESQQQ
ncbi:anaerobic sulfatase maturase [Photobacterium gaetbulicola]|uniref:Putative arylsulfatase-activating protein aslB n=1 Tax=Photobacterium gaetbulicola Gung47 TaxID=658445 RepID=A0A0C5W3F7_9GAMM|nr:anaerobic sulfatase maturase [Photobacterium gaetbulicola]AJR05966.1 putative arylsulfatase-activating protein aslB [Photobacterium gaetbulicola Gung47]PSU13226.1 anaerobic sulfatase maturase [Photobacterium gaetbulicola]